MANYGEKWGLGDQEAFTGNWHVAYQFHGTNVGPMGAVRSGNGNETGGVPFVATSIAENQRGEIRESEISPQLSCGGGKPGSGYSAVAFQTRIARNGRGQLKEVTDALTSCEGGIHADSKPHVAGTFGVRRLLPVECERLQGFPDGWTEGLSNSARYRALGNAVAVPVAEWIGRRLMEATQ